jgi:hypothetical protein
MASLVVAALRSIAAHSTGNVIFRQVSVVSGHLGHVLDRAPHLGLTGLRALYHRSLLRLGLELGAQQDSSGKFAFPQSLRSYIAFTAARGWCLEHVYVCYRVPGDA